MIIIKITNITNFFKIHMNDLEKGLYEKCGKYDFGELVAKELKKGGIPILFKMLQTVSSKELSIST